MVDVLTVYCRTTWSKRKNINSINFLKIIINVSKKISLLGGYLHKPLNNSTSIQISCSYTELVRMTRKFASSFVLASTSVGAFGTTTTDKQREGWGRKVE